jgi:hypothetical protein
MTGPTTGRVNIELQIQRDREGAVCWIGYRLEGDNPAEMTQGTARNLDAAVQRLLENDAEALGLWRESFCGAPLPQHIAADGWVNVYD